MSMFNSAQDKYDAETPPRYEDARPIGRCDDCDRPVYEDDCFERAFGVLFCAECFAGRFLEKEDYDP